MNRNHSRHDETWIGSLYAMSAYTLWGLLPLYWKVLKSVPAGEILAHRIFWSFIFVGGLIVVQHRWQAVREILRDRRLVSRIGFCTVLISVNWFLYIWAVNSDHIIEASMGYYINPLVVIFLGMLVLRERLNRWQGISVVLAAVGVVIMTVEYGKVPWIALSLAVTFGLYGLFKKLVNVEAMVGLGIETMLISPLALGFIVFQQVSGTGALGSGSLLTTLFLIGAGVATATPLLWFAEGARRIPLSAIGFYQYISPTISLMLGIFLFKESFTTAHAVSFGLIWAGLIIYTLSKVMMKPERPERGQAA